MQMNVWAVPAVMVCSMCGATVASAQDDEPSAAELARAKQLYINGRELFSEEKYREAVDAWREGYRLSRKPAFLHNMGLAYEQMGFIEEAIDTLTRYRAFARPMKSRSSSSTSRRSKNGKRASMRATAIREALESTAPRRASRCSMTTLTFSSGQMIGWMSLAPHETQSHFPRPSWR